MSVLVSCSKIVATHDLLNSQPILTFEPHKGNINAAIWSHNSNLFRFFNLLEFRDIYAYTFIRNTYFK